MRGLCDISIGDPKGIRTPVTGVRVKGYGKTNKPQHIKTIDIVRDGLKHMGTASGTFRHDLAHLFFLGTQGSTRVYIASPLFFALHLNGGRLPINSANTYDIAVLLVRAMLKWALSRKVVTLAAVSHVLLVIAMLKWALSGHPFFDHPRPSPFPQSTKQRGNHPVCGHESRGRQGGLLFSFFFFLSLFGIVWTIALDSYCLG